MKRSCISMPCTRGERKEIFSEPSPFAHEHIMIISYYDSFLIKARRVGDAIVLQRGKQCSGKSTCSFSEASIDLVILRVVRPGFT